MSFESLGLVPELVQAVSEKGYSVPSPVQRQAIKAEPVNKRRSNKPRNTKKRVRKPSSTKCRERESLSCNPQNRRRKRNAG